MDMRENFSIFVIVALISGVTLASFHEGWESASVGVYTPTCGDCVPALVHGDEGLWYVGDTVSEFPECGPTPHRAEILMHQGSKAVRLTSGSSNGECADNVWIDLSNYDNLGFSIPLTSETVISFEESGELIDPQMHGWGRHCIDPPCFDNVSLQLTDNKGNILAYVLQRCPWATPNVHNALYGDTYREVFLDPDAGSYRRNLYEDFLTIPEFSATNAKIVLVVFQVNEHGWAMIDNISIGGDVDRPEVEILDADMITTTELGMSAKIKFPESMPDDAERWVEFSATINGIEVIEVIPLTDVTEPGVQWGCDGINQNVCDLNGNMIPTTPLKINLNDVDGVDEFGNSVDTIPRFMENKEFELKGVAVYELQQGQRIESEENDKTRITVKIRLPVVVLHGYIYPYGYPYPPWLGGNFFSYLIAYKGLTEFLEGKGYKRLDTWPSYGLTEYKTLWVPFTGRLYTNPNSATPGIIKADMDDLLGEVWEHSHADKVNLIGHSFGGLVSRFYAFEEPDKVNMVITAGTPHLGTTNFWFFGFRDYRTRESAELNLAGIINWTTPVYPCLYECPNLASPNPKQLGSFGPPFDNTFNYGEDPSVKRYSLYSKHHDTRKKLYLQQDGNWYRICSNYNNNNDPNNPVKKGIMWGDGDNYMLSESAKAFGTSFSLVEEVNSEHHKLLNNIDAQAKIYELLSGGASGGTSSGGNSTTSFMGNIGPMATVSHPVTIGSGAVKAAFQVSWPGSDLDLVLVDPTGAQITPDTSTIESHIEFAGGDKSEEYTVFNPSPGQWSMVITAVDVPADGEEYVAFAHFYTNLPPVADAGDPYSGNCGVPITFDASVSNDPEGQPIQYRWDFDADGLWDTDWLTEPTISHTWEDAYEGAVYLEVTDGELTTIDFALVDVTAPHSALRLSKVVVGSIDGQPIRVDANDTVAYNIRFDNEDDSVVTNVSIVDVLPKEVRFVSADGDGDFGRYDAKTHTYTWAYASLPPDTTTRLELVVWVNADTDPNTTITNYVTIDSDQTSPTVTSCDVVFGENLLVVQDFHILPEIIRTSGESYEIQATAILPSGIGRDDVMDVLPTLYPGEVAAKRQIVHGTATSVKIIAMFDKTEVVEAVSDYGEITLKVVGELKSGQSWYGEDTVYIGKFTGG